MDDKNKDTLTVGSLGAIIGGAVGGPSGVALGGIAGAVVGSRERKHNRILRNTFYELQEVTNNEAQIYADHIEPSGAEPTGPKNVIDGVSGVPDLICIAQCYSNLIVEVETVEAIENSSTHVIKQLNDFQTQGFKRVLVVPKSEVDDFLEWCEIHERRGNLEREIIISTPAGISAVL